MTQLIVSIDNPSMIDEIKNAIRMIKGVYSVKTEKKSLNVTTKMAIDEAMSGKTIKCGSFEDYKKLVADLDNV